MELTFFYYASGVLFAYLLYFSRKDPIGIFIVILCFHGFIAHFGKSIENTYKIILASYMVVLFIRYNIRSSIGKNDLLLLFAFFLFSLSFFVSAIVNADPLILTLSQYFSKYLVTFFAFFMFKSLFVGNQPRIWALNKLLYLIILVQIILSIIKFLSVGLLEGVVGSLSSAGGAIATTFPVYALFILWIYKNGKLNRNSWLIIAGIFFIGFSSDKRAIWYIMPLMLYLIYVYMPSRRLSRRTLFLLPFIPVIFYLGVRLNPSLNPERKIWGSFNYAYMMDYTTDYSLGSEELQEEELAYGRVSSTFTLFSKMFSFRADRNDLFGIGQDVTRSTNYHEFLEYDTGLGTKMALNGFYRSYITTGYFGILTISSWFLIMLGYIKHRRFRITLFSFIAWDYFFYHGNSLDTSIIMVIIVFLIWNANGLIYRQTPRVI